ncbi:MAG: carboxypeptidase regulatory-like domain-containing protein [Bacteroidetes bacterium]|nr:carboxypeptidase regulatory-like domain-containing protein [Bacteroidota bacterium]
MCFRANLFFLILFFVNDTFGQNLSGIVIDSSGLPIKGVSVYLTETNSKKITGFSLTNEKGEFLVSSVFIEKDSLAFSHIGYKKVMKSISDFQKNGNVVKLFKVGIVLTEVVVKSPIWVNGDTTKFSADYFKEQSDRKLKDLVGHIPGFEITNAGKLKYNNKVVEKITIEGEDLFSDKTTLLLNSLPIHAIEEIQLLQNQHENKKLKNFESGDRLFLNLSLKKRKLKMGFGDAELGANTKGRGLANFTNFTLAPKIKLGFIGGFESLGQSTLGLEDELKDAPYKEQDAWMLTEPYVETYFRVPDVYYKFNNLVNARLKINTAFSKRLSSETELHFLLDRQSQSSANKEIILDTSGFIEQIRYSNYIRKPMQALVNEKLHWDISDNKDLKLVLNWEGNFLKASEQRNLARTNISDSTANAVQNNKNSASINIEYLNKVSVTRADFFKILLYAGNFNQEISGVSQSYFLSFDLPYTGYGRLNYPLNVKKEGAQVQYTRMLQRKNNSFSYGIVAKYDQVVSETEALLKQLSSPEMFNISFLSNQNRLDAVTGKIFIKYPLSVFEVPINIDVSGGAQYYAKQYPIKENLVQPTYDVSLTHENRKLPSMYNVRLRFYNQLPALFNFNSFFRPVEFNGFRATSQPLDMVDYQSLDVFFKLGKSKYIPFTSFGFGRESAGFASKQYLKPNIQLISDTLIRKANYNANLQFNWNVVPKKTKLKVNAYYFLFYDQGRLLYNDSYYLRENVSMRWNLKLSRDWKKKFFSSLETGGDYFIPGNNNSGLFPMENILNWNLGWKNKYQVVHSLSLGLDATYFKTKMSESMSVDFMTLDFSGNFQIPKSPFNIFVAVQNILNQKNLSYADQSPSYQRFFQIPLQGVNFFLKLGYEM